MSGWLAGHWCVVDMINWIKFNPLCLTRDIRLRVLKCCGLKTNDFNRSSAISSGKFWYVGYVHTVRDVV